MIRPQEAFAFRLGKYPRTPCVNRGITYPAAPSGPPEPIFSSRAEGLAPPRWPSDSGVVSRALSVIDPGPSRSHSWLAKFGPGVLVAATGVGAGDLATAAFTGDRLGTAVLWAVVVGAMMKFVVTEGIGRWQTATGEPLLQSALSRLGMPARLVFGAYLFPWCFFVGAALISACGTATHALLPVFDDAGVGKSVWGVIHAIAGVALVLAGGFRFFERVMAVCIGVMFVSTTVTAVLLAPDWLAVLRGLALPTIPSTDDGAGIGWTVGLIGGVGGTLTVLCYGYWRRESDGGKDNDDVTGMRLDLGIGYAATAIFGIAMVIIGSTVSSSGSGAGLIADLGSQVGEATGSVGRLLFLAGAWAAMVSSLLGVFQAVPLLGVEWLDSWRTTRPSAPMTKRRPYAIWMVALALIPMLGLFLSFKSVQKYYAVFSATFLPWLAIALLIMNGRKSWVGSYRNGWWTIAALSGCIAFFVLVVILKL